MKICGWTSALLFSLLILGGCGDNSNENGDNGLVADDAVFYFGRPASTAQIYSHVFNIENQSDSTVVIDRVTTTCGCTSTGVTDDTLLPGEEAQVAVFFNSRGYTHATTKGVHVYHGDDILELSFQIDCGLLPTFLDYQPDTVVIHADSVLFAVSFTATNNTTEELLLSPESWYSTFYDRPDIDPAILRPGETARITLSPSPGVTLEDYARTSVTLLAVGSEGSETSSIAITDNPNTGIPPDTKHYPDK